MVNRYNNFNIFNNIKDYIILYILYYIISNNTCQ